MGLIYPIPPEKAMRKRNMFNEEEWQTLVSQQPKERSE